MTNLHEEDFLKMISLDEEDVFKMTSFQEKNDFKTTEELKEKEFKFKNKLNLNSNSLISNENVLFCDFEQENVGNCCFVAALASMSQRPEFLTEIAPFIHRTTKVWNYTSTCFTKGILSKL